MEKVEKLTKNEVAWIVAALTNEMTRMEREANEEGGLTASLKKLRAEQYDVIALKLSSALGNGDRRIKIV